MRIQFTVVFVMLALMFTACESAESRIERQTAEALVKGDQAETRPDGMAVFRKNCVVCHGSDGKLGLNGAKDLTQSTLTAAERTAIVTHGKNLMTPFGKQLSADEIDAVVHYTLTLSKQQAQ
jgi:cytochrome c6